ncbi:hypothetical protein AM231_09380 [Paenibacillus solani]|uniref:Uncharacterized protein n=1 Tax=Paenibacillus solani TaxID=1705565 RepID=A0A0M1P4J4_9BACL|nr:hypothetical protein AM231_09380 [Paenibacillus solani]
MLGKHPKSRTLLLLISLTLIIGIAAAVLKEQVRASAHEVVLTVEDEPVTVQKLSGEKNIVPLKV